MSGGGGTTTQTTRGTRSPWDPSSAYLTQALQGLQGAYKQPPSYYGGNLTVGPTTAENAAWDTTNQYNAGYFGQGGQYGQATDANNQLLQGGPQAGFARSLAPGALGGLDQLGNLGQYGLGQLGTAGSLDATGAIQSMLSGQPDYTGLQGAIDAANNPILRNLNQQVIPGLNSQATFLNNSTGGIKSLGTILPDVAGRLSENALGLTNNERLRALGAQQYATGLVTQGGLQQDSQGLQAQDQWANQRLGLGQLLGSYAGAGTNNQQTGIGNAPGLYNLGAQPSNAAQAYAAWDRGLQQNDLNAQLGRFNYLRDQPIAQATGYANAVRPFADVGGTSYGQNTSIAPGGSFGFGDALQTAAGLAATYYGGPAAGAAVGAAGSGKGGGQGYQVPQYNDPNVWNLGATNQGFGH